MRGKHLCTVVSLVLAKCKRPAPLCTGTSAYRRRFERRARRMTTVVENMWFVDAYLRVMRRENKKNVKCKET